MKRSNSGFTLIELLIVIAIIGVLSAVLVPNLLSVRARAFDVATISCLKQLGTAQEAARAQYPFTYDAMLDHEGFLACQRVTFEHAQVEDQAFTYTGYHPNGQNIYTVGTATSVIVTLVGGVP